VLRTQKDFYNTLWSSSELFNRSGVLRTR
jgi:hypothetical protein